MSSRSLFADARAATRLLATRWSGGSIPLAVCLSVTDRCNAACSYCVCDTVRRAARPDPSREQLCGLLDQMADAGTRRVNLYGGEPLLRDDIAEIAAHSRRRDLETGLNTNGTLLPERRDVLGHVDFVALSLDAAGGINDRCRGARSYDHAVRAMEVLRAEGKFFYVNAVLSRATLEDDFRLLDLADEYGFYVQYTPLFRSPDPTLVLDDAERAAALRRMIELKRQGRPVFFSFRTHRLLLDHVERGVALPRCTMHRFGCTVDTDGGLYPCGLRVGEGTAPNAFRDGFDAAFPRIDDACTSCGAPGFLEQNLIARLEPEPLWNLLHFQWRYRMAKRR